MSEKRKKVMPTLIALLLIISVFTNIFVLGPIVMTGSAVNITNSSDSSTTLNLTIEQLQPRINWYDLRNSTGDSMLNAQLDVNQEYTFIVNISSDQGWDDIEFINITAWADLGNDSGYNYNGTSGENINLFLSYDNTSNSSAVYSMIWPSDEVTIGSMTETNVSDPEGSPINTECHNLTFSFTPGYQWRYAPGNGWNATAGYNDEWSWNFNITVLDYQGYYSYQNPEIGETVDEFGVYSYTEIVSAGWPTMSGSPGTTANNDSYITLETRSNGNYSLEVNVTNLTHTVNPSYYIQNTSIQTAGGDLGPLNNFNGTTPIYYYGNSSAYKNAENNDASLSTTDIEWAVVVPPAQQAGNYEASIFYYLKTET